MPIEAKVIRKLSSNNDGTVFELMCDKTTFPFFIPGEWGKMVVPYMTRGRQVLIYNWHIHENNKIKGNMSFTPEETLKSLLA